jgi:hypothetical protein
MRFIKGQVGKSIKSIMLVGFSSFTHGFELLEGNVHDQDAPPNGVGDVKAIGNANHSNFSIRSQATMGHIK